jgi:hypothetical protein
LPDLQALLLALASPRSLLHRLLGCFVNRWSGVQISHPAPVNSDA